VSDDSSMQQARAALDDAVSTLAVGDTVSTTDGNSAVIDSTTLVTRYKNDQSLCSDMDNSATYTLPDRSSRSAVQTRLSAASAAPSAAGALESAENQQATSNAQAKQTLDNAQNAITDAQNQQTVTLMKDQQAIVTAQRQLQSAQTSLQSTIASNAAAASPSTQ